MIEILLLELFIVIMIGTITAAFAWENIDEIKSILHEYTIAKAKDEIEAMKGFAQHKNEEWFVLNKKSGSFIGASSSKEWAEQLQHERMGSVIMERSKVEEYRKNIVMNTIISRWDYIKQEEND